MRRRYLLFSIAAVALFMPAGACPQTSGQVQQPKGNWQTPGQIQQPKGTWQVPGELQKPGDIQKVQSDRCHERLTVGSDALFEFNQAALTPQAQQTLDALGPMIQQAGKHPVAIQGYTDSIGTDAYNQILSERRAQAVESWLVSRNYIDAAAATVQGFGKSHPVAPNTKSDGSDNPEGRARNRRVEVVIDTCR